MNEWELKHPVLARGALSAMTNMDISYRLGLEFPDSKAELFKTLLGPTYSNVVSGSKAINELFTFGRPGEHSRRFIASLTPLARAIPGINVEKTNDGYRTIDYRKRTVAHLPSFASAAGSLVGFRSKEAFQQSQLYQINEIYRERLTNYRTHHINKLVEMMQDGRNITAALRQVNNPEGGVVPGTPFSPDIKRSEVNQAFRQTNEDLFRRKIPKKRRKEFLKHLDAKGINIRDSLYKHGTNLL